MSASTATGAMDAIALNLFEQLQGMTVQDRRFILIELDGHIAGAAGERVVLVRAALELFARETGEPLRRQRYERWRAARADADALPSAAFIVGTWNGSWGNAVDELGLVAAPDQVARLMLVRGVSPTTTQLLDVLGSCATELGRTPTLRDFRLWKRDVSRRPGGPVVFSPQTYREHFGGWLQALDAAGLPRRGRAGWVRTVGWTRGDAIGYVRQAAAESGGRLTYRQYDEWRRRMLAAGPAPGARMPVPSGQSIAKCFGGWIAAVAAAGLTSPAETRARQHRLFSDAEIEDALARFARETTGSVSSCAYERWQHRAARGPGVRPPGREMLAVRNGGWVNVAARIRAHRLAAAASVSTDKRADAGAPVGAIAA
jgi:Homing endonuclease associated repeat